MSFDILKIWHEMDFMARGVTFALLAMGVASLAVVFERLVAFARSSKQSQRFAEAAAKLAAEGNYDKLQQECSQFKGSHLARMLNSPLSIYLQHEHERADKGHAVVELVRRDLLRQHEETGIDLRRGLNVLASVGSIAPFVGLLGTVVGIIAAFTKISATGSGGLASVAGGISEALVVTALGLLIAIPAVLVFNWLSSRADRIHQGLSISAGQFIDHLEFRHVGGLRARRGELAMNEPKETSRVERSSVPAA